MPPRSYQPLAIAAADLRGGASAANPWVPLLWGAAAGVLAAWLPFFGFFARAFSVAVHEALGHSAAYWFIGQPSIPAPNLFGMTGHALTFGFSQFVYGLWLALWAWALLASPLRHVVAFRASVALAALAQAALVFTPAGDAFAQGAGHGAEVFWAFALALWAAARRHATPVTVFLWALGAGALAMGVAMMAYGIAFDPSYRDFYLQGRQDLGVPNDLTRLAGPEGVVRLAAWYLAASVASVPAGLALGRAWRTLRDAPAAR